MRIAVAGGTGVVGSHAVDSVQAAGHDPVVLARSVGVNLVSGAGLADALAGVDVVIDASNVETARRTKAEEFFTATTGNLLSYVELAVADPAGRVPDLAGPEVFDMADLVRQVPRKRGEKRAVLQVRLPGRVGHGLARGALTAATPGPRGARTFASWLAAQ